MSTAPAVASKAAPRRKAPAARARITAVTSGEGGVSKTFVGCNLAADLARQGRRVLVLEAGLGLADLDVMLDLAPKITLHAVFMCKSSLEDAILPAPGCFSALLAGCGMVEYSRMTPEVRDQLLKVIDGVAPRYDHVLLDTAAGISDVVLYAISLADEVLVVVTREPTSMTDAYATIKVLAATQSRRPGMAGGQPDAPPRRGPRGVPAADEAARLSGRPAAAAPVGSTAIRHFPIDTMARAAVYLRGRGAATARCAARISCPLRFRRHRRPNIRHTCRHD